MAIYSNEDFKADKELRFRPLLKEPGPSSQDLHISRLFLHNISDDIHTEKGYLDFLKQFQELDVDESWSKFRRKLKEVSTRERKGEVVWILKPGTSYLAETVEKITLPKSLGVDVDTRSSYARYGLRVQHVDDELGYLNGYEGHIPLLMTISDVPIILRPRDRVCQAVVYEEDKGMLNNKEIYEKIGSGDIDCYTPAPHDSKLKMPNFMIKNHSIQLTLHPIIKRFRETVIDPKKDQTNNYIEINLESGKEIPYRKFFLGSSNEIVRIGNGYVGLLRELFTSPERVRTHSNAGYFDPGFEGTATLEQYIMEGGPNILYPDMKMGEMEICRLKTECSKPYCSKYSGQYGATPGKAHLDF